MNLSKKISLALVALAGASSSFAQSAPAATTSSTGLLGQRYAEAGFSLTDAHNTSDNLYGVGVGVNLPVTANVDLGFDYGYSWLKTGGAKFHDHAIDATATGYTTYSGVKPFAGLGLGYEWAKTKFGGFSVNNDSTTWGLTAGVEIPAGEITVTPRISYSDSFDSHSIGVYNYGVEASTWITKTLGGFADVSYSDAVGRGGQAWNYGVGLRVRF